MVRSSMISMGAASEPARSSRAVSLASTVVMRPEICTRPPPISLRITGAVTTSPLPFSNSRMAMRLPMFSRVMSRKMRPPLASSVRCTWAPGSGVEARLGIGQVVAGQDDLLLDDDGWPLRSR
jgi:hypothetical protein